MNLTLRQMRIFEATARLERLNLAAEEQAISQSAASQAMKEMEGSLNYSLFERRGRSLLLSDDGKAILPTVRQILELTDSLDKPEGGALSGTMTLAASITIASYVAPSLIAQFIAKYPQTGIKLKVENTEQVMQSVAKGRALLGMIEGPALHPDLTIAPWRTDRLVVFCAADHPLAKVRKIGFSQMHEYPWIVREPGSGTRTILDAALQHHGVKITLAQELNRQEAIKQSVIAGLGIGCLSELAIARELESGHLVQLATPLDLSRQFSWVFTPERERHPLVAAFIKMF